MNAMKLPQPMEPYRKEIETYLRELPRLLEDGEDGRHVLIKGDTIHGVWDTYADGVQHGLLTFQDRHFLVQPISRTEMKRIELYRKNESCMAGAVA